MLRFLGLIPPVFPVPDCAPTSLYHVVGSHCNENSETNVTHKSRFTNTWFT